ncbi:MAG: hypothetical protein NC911_07625 [Candidatus Omnitrophica bacterium]|nr:hypothetical protein [Candidatus Omnitrophota bacterium]
MNRWNQDIKLSLAFFLTLLFSSSGYCLRLYLEAEDALGLKRYPYDQEQSSTWYSREANTRGWAAPGRGWCAAIHENASLRKATIWLDTPLPPGKYQVSIRTIGPTAAQKETIVQVTAGSNSISFSWKEGRKRFLWQPLKELILTEPTSEVSFEVVQFGGRGYGGLTEPLFKSVWIDTLYFTDNLQEKEPPDYLTEISLRAGLNEKEIIPRPVYQSDEQYETPLPKRQSQARPIVLQSFDRRVNLWPNSSFELGMNDGWAGGKPYVFSDRDLVKGNAFHGQFCLKLPAGVEPFSRPYYLPEAGSYCLSFYVRSETKGNAAFVLKRLLEEESWKSNVVKTVPALKKPFLLSSQWQRVSASGQLEKGWYYLSFSGPEFFLDAIQLEKGEKETPYAPRAEVEGALRTGCLGNIIYQGQRDLILWLHNSSQQTRQTRLNYQIVDVREKVISAGKTNLFTLQPGQTFSTRLGILPELKGIFSITFAVFGRTLPEGETVYVLMPKLQEKPSRHQLGANISLNPAEIEAHSRLGLRWVLTCKTREIAAASEGVHPTPDTWKWVDDSVLLPSQFGLNLLPAFWPHRIPSFMQEKLVEPEQYRTVRGKNLEFRPRLDLWKNYVASIANHYRLTIKDWCVDDEAECSWTPDYYAPVVLATADAVHQSVAEAKVGLSATPEFTEELFRYVPADKIDFLGGSFFDFYYYEGKHLKTLKDRYGKPVISFGVGGRPPENTMYHTLYTFKPPYFKAAWMARLMVYQFFNSDLDVSGHYAGILRNDGAHLGLNKPLLDYDGTPYPWGATFGCLGTLLADAVSTGEIRLGHTGPIVFLFQTDEVKGGVTFSTNVPENDMHWKPARRKFKNVRLTCPPGTVEILDMYWNKLEEARSQGNQLLFDLDEAPLFFINKKLSDQQFCSLLENASFDPEPVEISLSPQVEKNGQLSLLVTLKSHLRKGLKNGSLDFRPGQPVTSVNNPLSTSGCWLTPRITALPFLPPGKTVQLKLPTAYQAEKPLEAAIIRGIFKAEDLEVPAEETLWIVPVFPLTPVLDGQLTEWEKKPAAWLAYQRHWNFSYRWSQFQEGSGSFGYPSYTVDSRVSFWLGYDKNYLYLAIWGEDDQVLANTEEGFRFFLRHQHHAQVSGKIVLNGQNQWQAYLTSANGKLSVNLPLAGKAEKNSFALEIAIPWSGLNVSPAADTLLSFDLFWTDVDRENNKIEKGTMHWAGGSKYGYLFLR